MIWAFVYKKMLNRWADPKERMTLKAVAEHPWVIGEDGDTPEYLCWCKRRAEEASNGIETVAEMVDS